MTNTTKAILQKRLDAHLSYSGEEKIIENLNNEKNYSGVYLFFSFDLVNSTSFKNQYNKNWQKLFRRFYDLIENDLKLHYEGISLWKYIGDEVLLYLKVTSLKEVYDSPIIVYRMIKSITEKLYDDIPESKGKVFIKGTIWISNVKFQQSSDLMKEDDSIYNNIMFLSGTVPDWLPNTQQIDFLGPDIDLGFRLSKYTEKSKLLVSAELAYILNRKNGDINAQGREYKYRVGDYLKIISLEKLKGIWQERRYPIIWFDENWADENYEYDEYLDSELVKKIIDEETKEITLIEKIFNDLNKAEEIEELINLIDTNTQERPRKEVYNIPEQRLAEVHCAAICFNEKGQLLLAKRTKSKKRLQGFWEFGCGQIDINQSIERCLKLNYEKDFGAELNFLDDRVIPVTTYVVKVEEENRVVPGILFLAEVTNPDMINNNNHETIRWVDMTELDDIDPTDCVSNLHESAQKAYEIYSKIRKAI